MTQLALVFFELIRLIFRLMILVLCGHMLGGASKARRGREARKLEPDALLPFVTVQLPLFDEKFVASRVIKAACALDYPRDRFEVQVLDDSQDETTSLIEPLIERFQQEGVAISLCRRDEAKGFKAGALNEGLKEAHGEFVAIFDADCVPEPSFLRDLLGEFEDPKVGAVQARWAFMNRKANLLTRLQGLLFDGVFALDQHSRCVENLPSQFNGTNGIWRRQCLEEIGGWRGAVITEDLYASFSAILKGWKIIHRRDVRVQTEIPEGLASFRTQQKRWCAGSIQSARLLWAAILRAPLDLAAKRVMLMHLARHWIHPCILVTCLFSPLTTFFDMPFLFDYGVPANMAVILALLLSMFAYYAAALRESGEGLLELVFVPLLLPLTIGLSAAYTQSIISGLFARELRFIRTPKKGVEGEGGLEDGQASYASRGDGFALFELGMAGLHLYATLASMERGYVAYTCFFGMVALGFGAVALASLKPFFQRS